jgi:hypothetical protein
MGPLIILEAYGGWSNRPVCGGGVSMFVALNLPHRN